MKIENNFMNFRITVDEKRKGIIAMGREKMKQLYKFLLIFCFLSIVGLLGNLINKHNLNILTAISVALGVSISVVFIGKKSKEK